MVVDMLSFELRTDHRGWESVRVWRLAIEGGGATSEAEGEAESSLFESTIQGCFTQPGRNSGFRVWGDAPYGNMRI